MEKKYIMTFDQGTTGSRALLIDKGGQIIASSYREFTQIFPQPGWVEHNPEEIWETTMLCGRDVLDASQARPAEIAAIGITNQRETTVLWERATGKPLYNAIVWQCRRTAPLCDRLKEAGLENEVRERTGLIIDPYFSATKIMWIRDHVEGAKAKIDRQEACAGCIDSWLIWKLTGGRDHVTDYSNASRTMLFNIKSLQWDDYLLKEFGIPAGLMPMAKPSSGLFGYTDEKIFEGERIPIMGVAGDQQAALFGQTCFKPGMVKNTYGTALVTIMNTGRKFVFSRNKLITDLAWEVGGEVNYALEGVVFTGGAVVQWLRDGLRIIDNAAETEKLAQAVADTGGVYMVPAFNGLCSPYWDPYARGTIVGITRGTSKEQIARAALESIAYQSRDLIDAMISDSGNRLDSLRVDGGATANHFLMQFQADILGIPIEKPKITEMTAFGAAYLAGLGIGFWQDKEEIAAQWEIAKVYEPRMSPDQREGLYAGWKKAVERSFGWAKHVYSPTEKQAS
ncbi:MAG: glycerol kinase GlpK [Desulfobacterales bacterium]|nr:MAG: glycerol kinase GlpK [Desulfobacterales bacterium]